MHELANCRRLIKMAEEQAKLHSATTITRLVAKVGVMSGIDIAEIRELLPIVARDSCLADTEILIESQPLVMACVSCGHEFSPVGVTTPCPWCASEKTRLVSGTEFVLHSIDVDAAPA